jgi:hypothetical protein
MGGKNISPVPAVFESRPHSRTIAEFHAKGGAANPALSVSAVLSDCPRVCIIPPSMKRKVEGDSLETDRERSYTRGEQDGSHQQRRS